MNMLKLELLNILNNINPISIYRKKQKVKHNKKVISHKIIFDIVSKELPLLVEEMPNFLEYEIYGFQKAAEKGEFTFPEYHPIEECILVYFKDISKHLERII